MNEIEDAVRARSRSVDKVGPGDGTLRRRTGAQVAESAGRAQFFQVRELAGFHHALSKTRVHAVNAENDEPPVAVPFSRLAGKQRHSSGTQQQEEAKFLDSSGMQGRP